MTAAIQTAHLTKSFGATKAVDDLSIEVRRGTVFGLLGENGAGKSTTVEMLATLLSPTSGDAWINGASIITSPLRVRESAAIVFETAVPPRPHWTTAEYLKFFAELRGDQFPSDAVLDLLGLRELLPKRTGTLSSGQRRRVELGRAFASRTSIVFLDEPTKELDMRGKRRVWNSILEEVVSQGKTVLLCSHDVLEIRELCDEVAVMNRGRVVSRLKKNEISGADPLELERRLTEAMR